jgi:hypothetical protein
MSKISKSDIVSSGKIVRPAGHEDLLWLDASQVIIVGEESEYKASGTRVPVWSLNPEGPSGPSGPTGPTGPTGPGSTGPVDADVPSLSDIESVTFEQYKNKEGVTKIKAFIKIRNSSKNKRNVKGVDARIPPEGE